jgi:SAM-dependent methyltransferase
MSLQCVINFPPFIEFGYQSMPDLVSGTLLSTRGDIQSFELLSSHVKDIIKLTRISNIGPKYSFVSSKTFDSFLKDEQHGMIIAKAIYADGSYDVQKVYISTKAYRQEKLNKLQLFSHTFACPECRKPLSSPSFLNFKCEACNVEYFNNGNSINFITEAARKEFDIVPTNNVSDCVYKAIALEDIKKNSNALWLDCGAGYHKDKNSNILNLEIVDYPSTEILSVGETLPFADNSFDGIISNVVLEHVKYPWKCSAELSRILKPGGTLYCAAPFLQPEHGYPHHYFNMTRQGLKSLFPDLKVVKLDVPLHLHPMQTLTWFINTYYHGLPEKLKEQFINMSIIDLINTFEGGKGSHLPIVTELAAEMQSIIACGHVLIATK